MSAAQHTNFVLIRQVLRQLRAFGLNPYDWQIDRDNQATPAGILHLRHRRDEDFRMRGQFEANAKGFAKLQALRVVSL